MIEIPLMKSVSLKVKLDRITIILFHNIKFQHSQSQYMYFGKVLLLSNS